MIRRTQIERVQDNLARVDESRTRVATGLRVEKPSDDPIAGARIMQTTSDLRANAQHRRNMERGIHRVVTEERVLDGLTNLLSRAREVAAQTGGPTVGNASRRVAATEIQGLIQSAVGLGNTRFGDTFLFGGMYSTQQPFAPDGSFSITQAPSGSHMVEVADNTLAETNHDGMTVFVNSGAISALQSLETALLANDTTQIASASGLLDGALDSMQELLGEVGVRGQVFETTRGYAEEAELDLLEVRSEAQDIDLDRAISELLGRQSSLEAALLAISRADRSLVDIL